VENRLALSLSESSLAVLERRSSVQDSLLVTYSYDTTEPQDLLVLSADVLPPSLP
jgi:hypothetical protein